MSCRHTASIAQLDRASVFGTEGWGFESLWMQASQNFQSGNFVMLLFVEIRTPNQCWFDFEQWHIAKKHDSPLIFIRRIKSLWMQNFPIHSKRDIFVCSDRILFIISPTHCKKLLT